MTLNERDSLNIKVLFDHSRLHNEWSGVGLQDKTDTPTAESSKHLLTQIIRSTSDFAGGATAIGRLK